MGQYCLAALVASRFPALRRRVLGDIWKVSVAEHFAMLRVNWYLGTKENMSM
jgi:hypothetical protein